MDRVRKAVVRAWDWERLDLDEWIDARHVILVARRATLQIVQANSPAREFFGGDPVGMQVPDIKPGAGPAYWLEFIALMRRVGAFSLASADYQAMDGRRSSGRLSVKLAPCGRYYVAHIWPITQPTLLQ